MAGETAWKDFGLSPEERAERFIRELAHRRRTGETLSLPVLTRWVTHLIYAVLADRLSTIAEEHKETFCFSCGAEIFCHHTVTLQQQIGRLKLENVTLKDELKAARQR